MLYLRQNPVAKNSMDKKWCIKIFRPKTFVSQCRTLSWGNTSVLSFINFPAAKNSLDKRGFIQKFRRKFSFDNAENFRKGTLLCCVSQNSVSEKDYG